MEGEEKRKNKKELAREFGLYAEEMAAQEYLRRGYTILERQFHLGKTEIDLIVLKDATIVIVEVKARATDEEDALAAITVDKRRRMIRAADSYLRRFPGDMQYRFDVVACTGSMQDFNMEIFEDAFNAADVF
ncbi:MAG: YraN family protein [Muribaculaceae bacterium]|nr:YraN family protein [Muribaculaceae bacterium]